MYRICTHTGVQRIREQPEPTRKRRDTKSDTQKIATHKVKGKGHETTPGRHNLSR